MCAYVGRLRDTINNNYIRGLVTGKKNSYVIYLCACAQHKQICVGAEYKCIFSVIKS